LVLDILFEDTAPPGCNKYKKENTDMLFFTSTAKNEKFLFPTALWMGDKEGEADCVSGGYSGSFENGRLVRQGDHQGDRPVTDDVCVIDGELGELLSAQVPPGDYNTRIEAAQKIARDYIQQKAAADPQAKIEIEAESPGPRM
jgi:hypothetical protein